MWQGPGACDLKDVVFGDPHSPASPLRRTYASSYALSVDAADREKDWLRRVVVLISFRNKNVNIQSSFTTREAI